jgi:hypothetical protein
MVHYLFRSFLPPAAILWMKLQMMSSEDSRIRGDLVKFLTSRQFKKGSIGMMRVEGIEDYSNDDALQTSSRSGSRS